MSAKRAEVALRAHKDPKLGVPARFEIAAEWLVSLSALNADQAHATLLLVRTLCPHDSLADPVYRRVVGHLDRALAQSPALRTSVEALLAELDGALGLPFIQLSESYRVTLLQKATLHPAFRFLQRASVRYLYDDLEVWQAFGYEGASYHLGGFVERGFDDLDWLPDEDRGAVA
jgi:hypothetical protein